MRADNRCAHRSLAQRVMAKTVLVAVCRRCIGPRAPHPVQAWFLFEKLPQEEGVNDETSSGYQRKE